MYQNKVYLISAIGYKFQGPVASSCLHLYHTIHNNVRVTQVVQKEEPHAYPCAPDVSEQMFSPTALSNSCNVPRREEYRLPKYENIPERRSSPLDNFFYFPFLFFHTFWFESFRFLWEICFHKINKSHRPNIIDHR